MSHIMLCSLLALFALSEFEPLRNLEKPTLTPNLRESCAKCANSAKCAKDAREMRENNDARNAQNTTY